MSVLRVEHVFGEDSHLSRHLRGIIEEEEVEVDRGARGISGGVELFARSRLLGNHRPW